MTDSSGHDAELSAGSGTPGAFRAAYELDEGGAALIRPDGHVAARWRSLPDDPAAELARVADQVLGTAMP